MDTPHNFHKCIRYPICPAAYANICIDQVIQMVQARAILMATKSMVLPTQRSMVAVPVGAAAMKRMRQAKACVRLLLM